MEEFRPLEAVAAPVFVIERDDQGTPRYIYCNPAYYDISAHVADDIIGRTAIEVFGPRLGKMLMARHDRALRGERMSYDVTLPVSQKIINNTLTPLPGGARQRILATSRPAGDRRPVPSRRLRSISKERRASRHQPRRCAARCASTRFWWPTFSTASPTSATAR